MHGDDSKSDSNFVAGKKTYIDDAITLCHGDNVFSDKSGYFVNKNNTELLSADLVVDASINPIKKRSKNITYVHMNPDDILRYSKSMLPGVKQLCALIDDKRKEKYHDLG